MTIRYSLSYADWRDYFEALTPHNYINPTRYYLFVLSTNGLLLAFSYFCFSDLNQIFLGIIAIYFSLVNLISAIPHTKFRKKSIEDQAARKTDYPITLEIADAGLTETAFDIVSFCPWKTVTSIQKFKGIIIIHLSSGLYGMIPCMALESTKMSVDDFISYLESKRQAQQDAAANP